MPVSKYINHVSGAHGGIVGVYQRHTFLPEIHEAVGKVGGEANRPGASASCPSVTASAPIRSKQSLAVIVKPVFS